MTTVYGVLARLTDNHGFVDNDEPTRYYVGNGMWSEKLGRLHIFDTEEKAAQYALERRNHVSWGNKIVHEFSINEKTVFKARLAGK